MNSRDTIARLEANMRDGDELMARVIDDLKQHADLLDEIETLQRYRSVMRMASASFVVEAKGILRDAEADRQPTLFCIPPAYCYRQ